MAEKKRTTGERLAVIEQDVNGIKDSLSEALQYLKNILKMEERVSNLSQRVNDAEDKYQALDDRQDKTDIKMAKLHAALWVLAGLWAAISPFIYMWVKANYFSG